MRLNRLGYLAIFLVAIGTHPAQAGCRTIWRELTSHVACDPPPELISDSGSSLSVYTEKWYEFTVHNYTSNSVDFDVTHDNGKTVSPFALGPGQHKSFKYRKAHGTNGDNVTYWSPPSIKLSSRGNGAMGDLGSSNLNVYIVDNGNGNVSLQSFKPTVKAQPVQPPRQNIPPYPRQNIPPYPQTNYNPYPNVPMGVVCFTYAMRCLTRGIVPIGTPCACFSPYGPIYGQIMY